MRDDLLHSITCSANYVPLHTALCLFLCCPIAEWKSPPVPKGPIANCHMAIDPLLPSSVGESLSKLTVTIHPSSQSIMDKAGTDTIDNWCHITVQHSGTCMRWGFVKLSPGLLARGWETRPPARVSQLTPISVNHCVQCTLPQDQRLIP